MIIVMYHFTSFFQIMGVKNTTKILKRLRALLSNTGYVTEQIHAYIVPSGDAHQVCISQYKNVIV